MQKIVNGCCPQYFKDYISYVNDKHRHNTRASTNNNLFIPLSRTNSGLRTFYASANRLWNTLDDGTRSISTLRNFKKYISNKYVVNNSKLDHFTIHRTFSQIKNGYGCATRFPKPLSYLCPKSAIFPTLSITWPKI